MPHIPFKNQNPGIVQAMTDYPKAAKPLNELAEILLRTDVDMSKAERELIAAHVSSLNDCFFCSNSHLNASLAQYGAAPRLITPRVDDVAKGLEVRPVIQVLLKIATKVQQGGKSVTDADVQAAYALGATDRMIHDTVLIAAAFCMYNRYVDGLATFTPNDPNVYAGIGSMLANKGYLNSI